MQGPYSQLEQAFRDTQVHRAEGYALRDLSRLVGVPQPSSAICTEAAWQDALQQAAYAPRAVPGTINAFAEALLQARAEAFVCSINPAAPTTLTWVSGGGGGFTLDHVRRLVRIDSTLGSHVCWTVGPDFTGAPGATVGAATLCAYSTALWTGAPFASLPATEQVTATVLPFVKVLSTPGPLYTAGVPTGTSPGDACQVLLLIKQDAFAKPTYLQPAGAATRPAGQQWGGQLLPSATSPGNNALDTAPGPDPGLPHGLYLADDGVAELDALLDRLLASGVKGVVRSTDFTARPAGIWSAT